jgi:steroid delta-isomerase-like uncharacterized protein
MSEQVAKLVTDLIAAWNAHDIDRIAAFYAENYEGIDVAYPKPRQNREDIRQTMSLYIHAFPDLCFTVEELVVQDSQAAVAWIGRGTHLGRIMNIPPTGREIMVRGTSFFTIKDWQITRSLHMWDVAGILRSMGLLPEL